VRPSDALVQEGSEAYFYLEWAEGRRKEGRGLLLLPPALGGGEKGEGSTPATFPRRTVMTFPFSP